MGEFFGDGFDFVALVEDGLDLGGEILESLHDGFALGNRQAAGAADLEADEDLS